MVPRPHGSLNARPLLVGFPRARGRSAHKIAPSVEIRLLADATTVPRGAVTALMAKDAVGTHVRSEDFGHESGENLRTAGPPGIIIGRRHHDDRAILPVTLVGHLFREHQELGIIGAGAPEFLGKGDYVTPGAQWLWRFPTSVLRKRFDRVLHILRCNRGRVTDFSQGFGDFRALAQFPAQATRRAIVPAAIAEDEGQPFRQISRASLGARQAATSLRFHLRAAHGVHTISVPANLSSS